MHIDGLRRVLKEILRGIHLENVLTVASCVGGRRCESKLEIVEIDF